VTEHQEDEAWKRARRALGGLASTALQDACPADRTVTDYRWVAVPPQARADRPRWEALLASVAPPGWAHREDRFEGQVLGPLLIDREYARALHDRLTARYQGVPVDEFRWPFDSDPTVVAFGFTVPSRANGFTVPSRAKTGP
jgi:hypothetical protein